MGLRIERDDYESGCDHPNRRRCHAKGPDRFGWFWHVVPAWHIWDEQTGDYAAGTGPAQFPRRRDAAQWLRDHPTDNPSRVC